ncbi:MAG: STAS domain-containing protein [Ruminococcaceae bacterium]|nr:STAS domain-containing protein [Oscillospiraceae bacterium]
MQNEEKMTIELCGRIDSGNAAQVEQEIVAKLPEDRSVSIVLNAKKLEYISSAGLRVILRVKKSYPSLCITEVNADVYDILEMTGFTEMMPVEKAYRTVSVEGCEEIGRGANGTIYRIDKDNVVKVYNNADALSDIQHEREVAKLALILGIPTAISYDVVKVGESYGSVFELLNARSFSKILSTEPDKMDWCVDEYVKMLKKIHGTNVPAGKLPDMKETALDWAKFVRDYLPADLGEKLVKLVQTVPHTDTMIHGDYHTKNLELQGDEVLIIDMDTLAVGHPIFELGSMFNAYIGFSEYNHKNIIKFQGFDFETATVFWKKTLSAYLGTTDEQTIRAVEDKARIIGYTRLIRRSIRRGGLEDPEKKKEIELWKEELIDLLQKVDTLTFLLNEIQLEARADLLPLVQNFIGEHLEAAGCPVKAQMQIEISVEEIYVNVANYAYSSGTGPVTVRVETFRDPASVQITFADSGTPYDPLQKPDPDITLSAKERKVGGLGIFMTKQMMDDISYSHKDGKNILTLKKMF